LLGLNDSIAKVLEKQQGWARVDVVSFGLPMPTPELTISRI